MAKKADDEKTVYEWVCECYASRRRLRSSRDNKGYGEPQLAHLGAVLTPGDQRLIELLKQPQPSDAGLTALVAFLERTLPAEPLKIKGRDGPSFAWFERVLIGDTGNKKEPHLPLGAAMLCMHVQPFEDWLDPWKVNVTLLGLWRNPHPFRHPWDRGDDFPGTDRLLKTLANLALDALAPGQNGFHQSEYHEHGDDTSARCVFTLCAPPAEQDPEGHLLAAVEVMAQEINRQTEDWHGRSAIFERFSLHDAASPNKQHAPGVVTTQRVSADELRRIHGWMDDPRGHKKPATERPAIQVRHGIAIVRDRLLQRSATGGVVESHTPPRREMDSVHWAFCVEANTATFYCEPFIPSQQPIDLVAFLDRAWNSEGESALRQKPSQIELPKAHLDAAARSAFEADMRRRGVELVAPKSGGGLTLSVARTWLADMQSTHDRAPLRSMEAIVQWARVHTACVLYRNLGPGRHTHDGLCRSISTMNYGHYSSIESVRYGDFCDAMGIVRATEEERLTQLVSQGVPWERGRRDTRFVQYKIVRRGKGETFWFRLQLPYYDSLFHLHAAIADVAGLDVEGNHLFTVYQPGENHPHLVAGMHGAQNALSVNLRVSNCFANPGQRGFYEQRVLGTPTFLIEVEDVVGIREPDTQESRPRYLQGEGSSTASEPESSFDPKRPTWTDVDALISDIYQ